MNPYKKLPYPKLFKMWDEVRYPFEDKHFVAEAVQEASLIENFSVQKWAVQARPYAHRYFGIINSPEGGVNMQPYHLIAVALAVGGFKKAWKTGNIFYVEMETTQLIVVNHVKVFVHLIFEYNYDTPKVVQTHKVLKLRTSYFYLGKSVSITMLHPNNKELFKRLYLFMDTYKEVMSKALGVLADSGKVKKTLRGLTYYNSYAFQVKELGQAQVSMLSTCNDKYTAFLWLYNCVKFLDISKEMLNSPLIERHKKIKKIFFQILGKKLAF